MMCAQCILPTLPNKFGPKSPTWADCCSPLQAMTSHDPVVLTCYSCSLASHFYAKPWCCMNHITRHYTKYKCCSNACIWSLGHPTLAKIELVMAGTHKPLMCDVGLETWALWWSARTCIPENSIQPTPNSTKINLHHCIGTKEIKQATEFCKNTLEKLVEKHSCNFESCFFFNSKNKNKNLSHAGQKPSTYPLRYLQMIPKSQP